MKYQNKDEARRHKLCGEILAMAGQRGMSFDDVFDECEVPAILFFFPSMITDYWENELTEYKECQLDNSDDDE
jgi:hypothetical protein